MHKFLGISESEYQKRQKEVENYNQERLDAIKILEQKYKIKGYKKKK